MKWWSTGHMGTPSHLKFQLCVQKVDICKFWWFQVDSRDPYGSREHTKSKGKSGLYTKYGQKWKKGVYRVKEAQNCGLQLSKWVFGKGIASRDSGEDIHEVKIHDF